MDRQNTIAFILVVGFAGLVPLLVVVVHAAVMWFGRIVIAVATYS